MDQDVAQCLEATFSADPNARIAAELRLNALQEHGAAGLSFINIALHEAADPALRQASALALRRYVRDHWSPQASTFKGCPPSDSIKASIREAVLTGLSSPLLRIRTACAFTVSEIAHSDWPEAYPSLLPHLLKLLSSHQPHPTSGALHVLSDLVRTDLTEEQLIPLSRDLLPLLSHVLADPAGYGPLARARCVGIFRQCLSSLHMVKSEYPAAVALATSEVLPQWLAGFKSLLEVPIAPELSSPEEHVWGGLAIRAEIFKTLDTVISGFPGPLLANGLENFIHLAVAHLDNLWPAYKAVYLDENSSPPSFKDSEETTDLETDLNKLVGLCMEFLRRVASKPASRRLLAPSVGGEELVNSIGRSVWRYTQVSADDEERWEEDVNAFVDEEEEEGVRFSTRGVAADLAEAMLENLGEAGGKAAIQGMLEVVAEADHAKAANSPTWWKSYEAVLMLSGTLASDLSEENGSGWNLGQVFEKAVSPHLSASDVPFLQGRAFVFSSQFADKLPQDHAKTIAMFGCEALKSPTVGIVVKASIVRALRNFFRHLPELVAPYSLSVLSELVALLPQTTETTTILLTETVQAALRPTLQTLDLDTLSAVSNAVLTAWSRAPSDPLLVDALGDLFSMVGQASATSDVLVTCLRERTIPSLVSAFQNTDTVVPAVSILDALFQRLPSPLGEGLFGAVAGPLFSTLAQSEDADVLTDGMNLLTSVIRKDVNQLLQWRAPTGEAGLDCLLRVLAHVLDPARSESGGLFVGDMILHLFRKAGGSVASIFPDLLKALAARVATAKTATFTQSMILPFAYLMLSQMDTVLSLLESFEVPTPSGSQSALHVVISAWCDGAETFQGFWNTRVSTTALTHLYMASRPSLNHITVRGNLIMTKENMNTIMTRAKTRANPDQFEAVPFRAKVLKLLVDDLRSCATERGEVDADPTTDEAYEDDGDEEWEDDGLDLSSKAQKDLLHLSDMLGPGARHILADDDEGNDEDDDPDLRSDPIYTQDMVAHLTSFFRHANDADIGGFRELSAKWLTADELSFLQKAVTSA